MDFRLLNPVVRQAALYEKINNTGFCKAYDGRLFYIVSGDLAIEIEGHKKQHLGPGTAVYIPAAVAYKLKAKYIRMAVFTFDLTADNCAPIEKMAPAAVEHFDERFAHITKDCAPFDQPILMEDMESERDKIISLCNIATSAEGEWRAKVSAELKLILLKIAETKSENALPAVMVEALDEYIRENATEEISNTEIGAIFGYHPFYVSRMLKEKKGITLRQYIISYRFKTAKRLLELTDKPVGEIAEETGFTDASYFAKSFKASFNLTPKDYRNQFEGEFI